MCSVGCTGAPTICGGGCCCQQPMCCCCQPMRCNCCSPICCQPSYCCQPSFCSCRQPCCCCGCRRRRSLGWTHQRISTTKKL
uniref:Ultrahigh sulfur keratin-associated protein n=1 Tax=Syphacia muris TaxID=451379 RepID=A0A0N5ACP2_9BILA